MQSTNNIKRIKKGLWIFTLLLFSILIINVAVAVPNSLTLQGKLTNLSGGSQAGTFNFTFRIYDVATNGNILYELANKNITTDANGIYDVILGNINLNFSDQYYLGITVATDEESVPRINLTSSPYSFRSNVSEGINTNSAVEITGLN